MAISDNLFLAILSMDAYNRGYNIGLTVNGNQIGNATLVTDSAILGTGVAQAVSFFAQAYSWNGKTVISYRGTDSLVADAWNGVGLAVGSYNGAEARLAAQFYQTVRGAGSADSVVLTGHSLGGGLAGFISGLYGSSAKIYDNMPFELSLGTFSVDAALGLNATTRAYFSNGTITPDPSITRGNIGGYYVTGEFLQAPRAITLQQTAVTPLDRTVGRNKRSALRHLVESLASKRRNKAIAP
jgi:hypothetical protein